MISPSVFFILLLTFNYAFAGEDLDLELHLGFPAYAHKSPSKVSDRGNASIPQVQLPQPTVTDQPLQNSSGLSGQKRKASILDSSNTVHQNVKKAKEEKVREQKRLSMQRFRERVRLEVS